MGKWMDPHFQEAMVPVKLETNNYFTICIKALLLEMEELFYFKKMKYAQGFGEVDVRISRTQTQKQKGENNEHHEVI